MKIYDVSVPICRETPVYPGDPGVLVEHVSSIARGDSHTVSRLVFGSHTGTHVDAPRHFLEDGLAVDRLPLDILVGKALVAEIPTGEEITRDMLARCPLKDQQRLLLKTANSRLWDSSEFRQDFMGLSEAAARLLVERGVKLVGIDYLSIEPFNGSGNVHRLLLENEVIIVEGLDLREVPPGEYELICLPLRIAEGDGAPVRAILRGAAAAVHAGFEPHSTRWPLA